MLAPPPTLQDKIRWEVGKEVSAAIQRHIKDLIKNGKVTVEISFNASKGEVNTRLV